MTEDRWRKVADVYGAAQDKTPSGRLPFVREAAAGDSDLRLQVESLLAEDERTHLLDTPLPVTAAEILDNSPVTPGVLVGPYRIESLLGVGGMGEVYRARDTKLNRDVAIKILPPPFANDPDRLARFKREAQVLASLNHPNIATIHGFEDGNGEHALVLELVEGPTLADRLQKGRLEIDEAMGVAKQIAEALEAAHEQGIIHRDLKPANIKVRDDGTVKVLDFGLAKLVDPVGAALQGGPSVTQSPTITTPAMTAAGMILGTAAYMSPEQAKGKPADKRSDIWAFACVLYEMLTGTRTFDGEDVGEVLASVIKSDPDLTKLPTDTPAAVRTLIRQALVKDPRRRVADISTARFVLGDPIALGSESGTSARAVQSTSSISRRAVPIAVAVTVMAAVITGVYALLRPSPPSPLVTKFSIPLGLGQYGLSGRQNLAVSPDGRQIVYVAEGRLLLRNAGEFESQPIPGTEGLGAGSVSSPVFSPDGRSIAFQTLATGGPIAPGIFRIGLTGGVAQSMCRQTITPAARQLAAFSGLMWDVSGLLFAITRNGIYRCAATTDSAPEKLVTVAEDEDPDTPQLLPGGDAMLFTVAKAAEGAGRWDTAQIVVQNLKSGARRVLVNGGSDGRYLPTGHLLYARGGIVYGVPFDATRQIVTGDAVPVIEGVRRPLAANTGETQFASSAAGVIAYVPGPARTSTERSIAFADGAGTITPLAIPAGPYVHTRISRDGARLVIGSEDGKDAGIWIYEMAGTAAIRRLTLSGANRFPVWWPDNERVAFQSDGQGDAGIFSHRADGTGPVERLTTAASGETHIPEALSPDSNTLLFSVKKDSKYALWALSLRDHKLESLDIQSTEPIGAGFSSDGRWLVYSTTPDNTIQSSSAGVFIQRLSGGDRHQVPKVGRDFQPVWSPRTMELFYIPSAAAGQIAAVRVTTSPSIAFDKPVMLPARVTENRRSSDSRVFDVMPDGRFIGLVDTSNPDALRMFAAPEIRVVVNWFEELKEKIPVAR